FPEIAIYAPEIFQQIDSKHPRPIIHNLLTKIYPKPDISQEIALKEALSHTIFGIQGPPGTGKSQTIAALVDEFIHRSQRRERSKLKILITAFSYAAIRVLIEKIRNSHDKNNKPIITAKTQIVFIRSDRQDPFIAPVGQRMVDDVEIGVSSWKWNGKSGEITKKRNRLEKHLDDICIICANAHSLYRLTKDERIDAGFNFDLIIVDEASQVPTDQFLSSLLYTRNIPIEISKIVFNSNTLDSPKTREKLSNLSIPNQKLAYPSILYSQIIIVGDYNQLPPVQPVDPPKNLKPVLDSLFSYYVKNHGIHSKQLETNYRSNEDIVNFTAQLGLYKNLHAFSANAHKILTGNTSNIHINWVKNILNPKVPVCSVIHNHQFEISVSTFEAELVKQLVVGYFEMISPNTPEEERQFWKEMVGIVAPHNAQGRLIIRQILDFMTTGTTTLSNLPAKELNKLLINSIYSVEKFQGSDRNLIIASIGLSDLDQIKAEEEFIYDLNRFNVLTSRAKNKIILVCSEKFLEYLPSDRNIMEQASQIRIFAKKYCNQENSEYVFDEKGNLNQVRFRWYNPAIKRKSVDNPIQNTFKIKPSVNSGKVLLDFQPDPKYLPIFNAIPSKIKKKSILIDKQHQIWELSLNDLKFLASFYPGSYDYFIEHSSRGLSTFLSTPVLTKKESQTETETEIAVENKNKDEPGLKDQKNNAQTKKDDKIIHIKKKSTEKKIINVKIDAKDEPLY
ncbi:MAG: AAA domain-containing protein, partial [Promethearchaeota archaeon]